LQSKDARRKMRERETSCLKRGNCKQQEERKKLQKKRRKGGETTEKEFILEGGGVGHGKGSPVLGVAEGGGEKYRSLIQTRVL